MSNKIQILRSSVAAQRPTGKEGGELYVNFQDRMLGYINAAGEAVDISRPEEIWINPFPSQVADPQNPVFMNVAQAYTEYLKTNPAPKGQFIVVWNNEFWTPDDMNKDLTDVNNWTNKGPNDVASNFYFATRGLPPPDFRKTYTAYLTAEQNNKKAGGDNSPYVEDYHDFGQLGIDVLDVGNPGSPDSFTMSGAKFDPSWTIGAQMGNPPYVCHKDMIWHEIRNFMTVYPTAKSAYLEYADLSAFDGLASISAAFIAHMQAIYAAPASGNKTYPTGNIVVKWQGKSYFHVAGSGALDTDWQEVGGSSGGAGAKVPDVILVNGMCTGLAAGQTDVMAKQSGNINITHYDGSDNGLLVADEKYAKFTRACKVQLNLRVRVNDVLGTANAVPDMTSIYVEISPNKGPASSGALSDINKASTSGMIPRGSSPIFAFSCILKADVDDYLKLTAGEIEDYNGAETGYAYEVDFIIDVHEILS